LNYKKTLKISLIVILGLIVIVAGYATYYYFQETSDLDTQKSSLEIDLENYNKSIETKKAELSDIEAAAAQSSKKTIVAKEEVSTGTDTSNWKTFTNSKYGYSFKYPSTYILGPCTSKPCPSFVDEQQGGDIVLMSGDITVNGWPNIQVMHYDTDAYNPAPGASLNEVVLAQFSWMSDYFPPSPNIIIPKEDSEGIIGADLTVPSSPQSYGSRYIFYIENDKLFQIGLNDPESNDAEEFYDAWVGTYKED